MSDGTVHIKLESGEEYDMPESVAMSAMKDFDDHGVKFSADDGPKQTAQPQSMFTEPDPSMKAPDARGTLEQLIDPGGTYGQAIADAGGDTMKGMTDAHGGPNAMLEEFLGKVSPIGSEARATENVAQGAGQFFKRLAGRTAEGAAMSGAQRASDSAQAGGDDSQVLDEFVRGLPTGAAFGFGGTLLGETGARIGKATSDASESAANRTLLRSTGLSSQEITDMSPEERAATAQKLRDSGITKGIPTLGTINERAKGVRAGGLDQMKQSEDAINALDQPPSVPVGDIIDTQRAKAAAQRTLADPANAGPANFREQFANNLQNDTLRTASKPMDDAQRFEMLSKGYQPAAYHSNEMPWERAVEQRRNIDGFTSFGSSNADESAQNAVRKEIGGGLRDGINSALDAPSVPPDLAEGWRGGRDAYSLGSGVAQSSRDAMPNSSVSGGSLGGQAMGWLSRNAGMSALSKGLSGASWMGDAAERGGLSMSSEAGRIGQQTSAMSATEQLRQVQSQSRGQDQPNTVEALLQQPPPWLQQYAPRLQQAQQDGKLNEELSKLRNTDDNWKHNVLPQLQMMTAQGAQ